MKPSKNAVAEFSLLVEGFLLTFLESQVQLDLTVDYLQEEVVARRDRKTKRI